MGKLVQSWFRNEQYNEACQFIRYYNETRFENSAILKLSTGMKIFFFKWIRTKKLEEKDKFHAWLKKNEEKEIYYQENEPNYI